MDESEYAEIMEDFHLTVVETYEENRTLRERHM